MDERRFSRACKLREEGRLEEAIGEFVTVAQLTADPVDKAGVLLNVATTFKALGDYDRAKQQLSDARKLFAQAMSDENVRPDNRMLQLRLDIDFEEADVYSFEGKIEEALSRFNQALSNVRNYNLDEPEFREAYEMIQTRRAFILGDLGRCQESLPILEEAESFAGPKNEIFFYEGHCYLANREYSRAVTKLAHSIAIGLPQRLNYRAHCELGIAYFRLKQYAQAVLEFEKCTETADEEYIKQAQIWKWLEESSIALGRKDQADAYAKRSLASGAR